MGGSKEGGKKSTFRHLREKNIISVKAKLVPFSL